MYYKFLHKKNFHTLSLNSVTLCTSIGTGLALFPPDGMRDTTVGVMPFPFTSQEESLFPKVWRVAV